MLAALDFGWRSFLFTYCSFGALILIARQGEKRWPIERDQPRSELLMDVKLVAVTFFMNWLTRPLVAVSGVALVNAAGGGIITLPGNGWGHFCGSLAIFMVVTDFYSYWSHRLSHAVPALWAMHSFHHSAEALTLITGARHLWLETAVNAAFFPVIAVLFKVPAEIVTTSIFLGFLPNGCAHLNIRLRLGRLTTWVNGPQWHRIHHSVQPEHLNKNFAAVLPLWDLVFGTAWIPDHDEFPETGLVPAERPGVIQGIIWPFRNARLVGRITQHAG